MFLVSKFLQVNGRLLFSGDDNEVFCRPVLCRPLIFGTSGKHEHLYCVTFRPFVADANRSVLDLFICLRVSLLYQSLYVMSTVSLY